MTDARVVGLNEQLKGISSVFFNLGAGTVAATAARFAGSGTADWIGIGRLVGALMLIWLGAMVLTLIEPEV